MPWDGGEAFGNTYVPPEPDPLPWPGDDGTTSLAAEIASLLPSESWFALADATEFSAFCYAGGVFLGPALTGVTVPTRVVPVTSWAPIGVAPTLQSGRWVMLGYLRLCSYYGTGLPFGAVRNGRVVFGEHFPTNCISTMVSFDSLVRPPLFRAIFGKRILR